jgi:DNA-binding NtrC family response regulator
MAKQILIVDDNPNMSALLAEMLEIYDYESVKACDGEDALEKLEDNKFSLVITDMRMPNMTGIELLEVIKKKYPKLPVVIISGYTVAATESDDSTVKPDGFLAKPFLMSDIEKLLNSFL